MDWFSRYVLAWEVSITMEKQLCLDALDKALAGTRPVNFNTDQGSQFTSNQFTDRLEVCGVTVSMDNRGRVFDNIFIERLWRTVKYKEIYLHSYEPVTEARNNLSRFFGLYNKEQIHSSLENLTPFEVYFKEQGAHITRWALGGLHLILIKFLSRQWGRLSLAFSVINVLDKKSWFLYGGASHIYVSKIFF